MTVDTFNLEQLTLASIVSNKDTDLLCKLSDSLFTGKSFALYNAIERHYSTYNTIPNLVELSILVPNSGIEEWVSNYKDLYIESGLLCEELESSRSRSYFIDEILKLADDINTKTSPELVDELSSIQNHISDMGSVHDDLLMDAVEIDVDQASDDTFKSGICSFFDENCGGFTDQSLNAISGTRGSGKSILLQNIANYHYTEYNNTVLYANIEMAAITVRQRLMSMLSGVPHEDIRRGSSLVQKVTIEIAKARFFYNNDKHLEKALIAFKDKGIDAGRLELKTCSKKSEKMLILDDASLSVSKLEHYVKTIKKKHNLKLVCVDYLQILKDSNKDKGTPDWLGQTLIAVQLKELAKKENLIIVTASQIHTDGSTKRALAIEDSLDLSLKFFPEVNATDGSKTSMLKFYTAKTRDSEARNFYADLDWNTLTLNYNASQQTDYEDEERKGIHKA